jgi:hypothetical protein
MATMKNLTIIYNINRYLNAKKNIEIILLHADNLLNPTKSSKTVHLSVPLYTMSVY